MNNSPDITPDSRRVQNGDGNEVNKESPCTDSYCCGVPPHPLTSTLPPGPCADCEPAFWSGVFLAAVVAAVLAVLVSVAI